MSNSFSDHRRLPFLLFFQSLSEPHDELHCIDSSFSAIMNTEMSVRFGIITDIHNNVTALEAVISKLKQMDCDRIICCGDIIGIGPCPEETVRFMMGIPGLTAVRGNHEKYLLEGMPDVYPNEEGMDYPEMEHHRWEHGLLSEASVSFLRSLPYRVDFDCCSVRISVMHWGMDGDGKFAHHDRYTTEEDLRKVFAGVDSDVILFGHSHRRNICRGDRLYVNAGSLGCPGRDRNSARAAVLTIENGKAEVEPLDVEYDARSVVSLIDRLGYPDSDTIRKVFYGL